jgi:peptidoglycan hydrolase CwlO-like protein
MPSTPRRRPTLRATVVTGVSALVVAVGIGAPSPGNADVAADRAAAQSLRAKVAAEEAKIARTNAGLAEAQGRLDRLEAQVTRRNGQLTKTQDDLVRARIRLSQLERKAEQATKVLEKNLVTAYETGKPDIVSVIVSSKGFNDLVEKVDFYQRISRHNGTILDQTRDSKAAVERQQKKLETDRKVYARLADEAARHRDQANVVRNAILRRREQQLRAQSGTKAQLSRVRSRIQRVEREQAAAARAARTAAAAAEEAPSGTRSSPTPSGSNSSGAPAAPSGSSEQDAIVARVIAAANEIASTPYVYGGGHGGSSGGYDCSGSISYALAAGGLISAPMASGPFMSWGEPGEGSRITVYANAGHAYMVIDGRRYDTSALRGGGTRWTSEMRSSAGFVARHPAGF